MAEAFLKSFAAGSTNIIEVFSAGTKPAREVHPLAVRVMKEVGIDLAGAHPKSVQKFLGSSFDFVITVCSNAQGTCPVFRGSVGRRLHFGVDDPTAATGSKEEMLQEFRRVRDDIRGIFWAFYREVTRNPSIAKQPAVER